MNGRLGLKHSGMSTRTLQKFNKLLTESQMLAMLITFVMGDCDTM